MSFFVFFFPVGSLLCSEQRCGMGQHHWQVGESRGDPERPEPQRPLRKDRQRDSLQRRKTHALYYNSR